MTLQTPNYSLRYPESTNAPRVWEDVKNLADDADAALVALYAKLYAYSGANTKGVNIAAGGSNTTTSATYVDMGAGSSLSFTKLRSDTLLRVRGDASMFAATSTATVRLGFSANGTDYRLADQPTYNTSQYFNVGGSNFTTAFAAGTYTIALRWLRSGGTGTLSFDGGGCFTLEVTEVAP